MDTGHCNAESSTPLEQYSPVATALGQKRFMHQGLHRASTIDTSHSDVQRNSAHESCPAASALISRASTRSDTDAVEGQCRKPQQALGRAFALDTTISANESGNSHKLQTHLSRASPKSRTLPQLAWPNKPGMFPKSRACTELADIDHTARSSFDQGESPHHGSDARSFKRLLTSEALDAQFEQDIAAMSGHEAEVGVSVSDEPPLEEAWESMLRARDEEELELPEFSKSVIQSVEGSVETLGITTRPTNRVETLVNCMSRVTINLARLRERTRKTELLTQLTQVLSSGVVSSASSITDSSDNEKGSESNMDTA